MPDPSGVPEPPHEQQEGPGLLASISRQMVQAMKKFYGKGPVRAKSYLVDDLLFVVMRGGTTTAEKTMLEADRADAVREFRQHFENEMAERLIGTIEQLTGRKVLTYQSQVLFDPDIALEIFVFDEPVSEAAQRETAEALLNPEKVGVEIQGETEGSKEPGSRGTRDVANPCRTPGARPLAVRGVPPVRVIWVTRSRLRQPTADHVADRQQGGVEPDLPGVEHVGAALFAFDGVPCDEQPDQDRDKGPKLRGLERLLGLRREPARRAADTASARSIRCSRTSTSSSHSFLPFRLDEAPPVPDQAQVQGPAPRDSQRHPAYPEYAGGR
jgi:uncharacterized protein YbcI